MRFHRSAPRLAALAVLLTAPLGLGACTDSTPESAMKGEGEAAAAVDEKAAQSAIAALSAEEQAAVRALVRDTLIANPEILLEAQEAYTAKMTREQNDQVAEAFPKLKGEAATLAFGPANAEITVIEFFDYRCPFCHASNEWTRNLMQSRRDIRFIFKQLPVLSENSVGAAQAAIAAHKQGKFVEFHHALMAAQGDLNMGQVMAIAASVGLDTARLQRDMADPSVEKMISDVNSQATSLGINGTPAFVINGRLIAGFKQEELDAALATAGVDPANPPAGEAAKERAG